MSIAAPSSYFYLSNLPIEPISKIVDYTVYMTYDLYGQVNMHFPPGLNAVGTSLRSRIQATNSHRAAVVRNVPP